MKTSIQTVLVENKEVIFFFDATNLPVVEIQGTSYHSLSSLYAKFPHLFHFNYLGKIVQIINFLCKGIEYKVIEDIDAFKDEHKERLESSQLSLLKDLEDRGIECGSFDFSSMHPPQIAGGSLVFFTKNDHSGIPYRVSLALPINEDQAEAHYESLPS